MTSPLTQCLPSLLPPSLQLREWSTCIFWACDCSSFQDKLRSFLHASQKLDAVNIVGNKNTYSCHSVWNQITQLKVPSLLFFPFSCDTFCISGLSRSRWRQLWLLMLSLVQLWPRNCPEVGTSVCVAWENISCKWYLHSYKKISVQRYYWRTCSYLQQSCITESKSFTDLNL